MFSGVNRNASTGIATLEASLILIVTLPLLLGSFALIDYTRVKRSVSHLTTSELARFNKSTLRINTGNQDYWLRARKSEIADFIERRTENLFTQLLATTKGAPVSIEVGYAAFQVNPQTGALEDFANSVQAAGQSDAVLIFKRGTGGAELLRSKFVELLARQSDSEPSSFAIPSALAGTRLQNHYGASHIYGVARSSGFPNSYRNEYPVSNYLRSTVVFGFALQVDMKNSYSGRVINKFVDDENRLIITKIELFSPRTDL